MKKIFSLFLLAFFFSIDSYSQYIHKIKADNVLITNDSCNAELNLENSTKDTIGFLYNKGKGRTEFRRGLIRINDSLYIIGSDTLNIAKGASGNYIQNQTAALQASGSGFFIEKGIFGQSAANGTTKSKLTIDPNGTYLFNITGGNSTNPIKLSHGVMTMDLTSVNTVGMKLFNIAGTPNTGIIPFYINLTDNHTTSSATGFDLSYLRTAAGVNYPTYGFKSTVNSYAGTGYAYYANATATGGGTAYAFYSNAGRFYHWQKGKVANEPTFTTSGMEIRDRIGNGSHMYPEFVFSNGASIGNGTNVKFTYTGTDDNPNSSVTRIIHNYAFPNTYRTLYEIQNNGTALAYLRTNNRFEYISTAPLSGTTGYGTDVAGGVLKLAGGVSSGTGAGGRIEFYTTPAGSSGSTLNPEALGMSFTPNGNLLIGTSNDIAQNFKLQIDGNIFLRKADNIPQVLFNHTTDGNMGRVFSNGREFSIQGLKTLANNESFVSIEGGPINNTSGTYTALRLNSGNNTINFYPMSGNAVFRSFYMRPTINQTGTANGSVYGLYYDPTLTSVLGTHWGLYINSGQSYLAGRTAIGTTSFLTDETLNINGTAQIRKTFNSTTPVPAYGSGSSTGMTGLITVNPGTHELNNISGVFGGITLQPGIGNTIPTNNSAGLTGQLVLGDGALVSGGVTPKYSSIYTSISGLSGTTVNHDNIAFMSTSGGLSAGQTITNLYHLYLGSVTGSGGTTGVTNYWGIYQAGGLKNYFNGNVLIGSNVDVPSAKLTVTSTTQGFLRPRMTTTQRDAIASPVDGLEIYNTTTKASDYYNGTAWVDGLTSSSNNFIKNQIASAQSANAWISGTMRADNLTYTPRVQSPSGNLIIATYNNGPSSVEFKDITGNNLSGGDNVLLFNNNTVGNVAGTLRLMTARPTINQSSSSGTIIGYHFAPTNTNTLSPVYAFYAESGKGYFNDKILIGSPNDAPSAKLIVESTTQGVLFPRMTTTQRNAIASPVAGLSVYNTTLNTNDTYNGSEYFSFGNQIVLPATNTATGTTGNQTINKASGTVNIAAGGTTVTVTNSLVSANSIVLATLRTNDATAYVKNVVPAAGSFTINLGAAATNEVSIGFVVFN